MNKYGNFFEFKSLEYGFIEVGGGNTEIFNYTFTLVAFTKRSIERL